MTKTILNSFTWLIFPDLACNMALILLTFTIGSGNFRYQRKCVCISFQCCRVFQGTGVRILSRALMINHMESWVLKYTYIYVFFWRSEATPITRFPFRVYSTSVLLLYPVEVYWVIGMLIRLLEMKDMFENSSRYLQQADMVKLSKLEYISIWICRDNMNNEIQHLGHIHLKNIF